MATYVDKTYDVVEGWKKAFASGLLSSTQFERYWIYCAMKPYCPACKKSNCQEGVLIDSLDKFICGGHPQNEPTSLCCKILELGEPMYSCSDCAVNNSSLCLVCFENSEHKYHNYRMSLAISGECCDCGKVKVWKRNGLCNVHVAENTHQHIADDYKRRMKIVVESVMKFACKYLTNFPDEEQQQSVIDNYAVILYDNKNYCFEDPLKDFINIQQFRELKNEGRVLIHHEFRSCQIVKLLLGYKLRDSKVLIHHAYTIASQVISIKLLKWLENFLRKSPVNRSIFAEIVLKSDSKASNFCVKVFSNGGNMWKSCGLLWHKVFVSGMLLEYQNRKALAVVLATNYTSIVHFAQGYSYDSPSDCQSLFCSITSQLFTMPSIAHYLIANTRIFYEVFETLREFFKHMVVSEPTISSNELECKLDILKDLKCLLGTVPTQWNSSLRKRFFEGVHNIVLILADFHGCDSITRYKDRHVRYERDFSKGLRIQQILSFFISSLVEWCGSDKTILCKVYRKVLLKLKEKHGADDYRVLDFSKNPISFHLPLFRLLAALHLQLQRYNLHFSDVITSFYPIPITPNEIIEPVLRCQVFFTQVNIGLWKRNGSSVMKAMRFYKGVCGRTEMLDRDIILLQIGASLMEPNEFLRCAYKKFSSISLLQSSKANTTVMNELLHFLLIIISERHVPGVSNITNEDRVQNEVIQRLCIESVPYWQLIEAIPKELLQDVDLDKLLKKLTNIKKDSNGMHRHELKSEYFEEYNMFFYHYTREEMSKSEEAQRLRRQASGDLGFCPPPKLLKLSASFNKIANFLQCNELLKFIKNILTTCVNEKDISDFEDVLQKVLYLIGYALQEEQSSYYPSLKFTEKSTEFEILSLLKILSKHSGIDSHKGLLQWTINKFKEVAKNIIDDVIIIDQEDNTNEKDRRKFLAEKKRNEILQQFAANANAFMKNHSNLYSEIKSNESSLIEQTDSLSVELGPHEANPSVLEKSYTCFICQEEEKVSLEGYIMVVPAFVQKSTVWRQYTHNELLTDATATESALEPAPHTSTCGHIVHFSCYHKFKRISNPNNGMIFCPFCNSLTNTLLPLVPHVKDVPTELSTNELNFDNWLRNTMIFTKDLKKEATISNASYDLLENHKLNIGVALSRMLNLYVRDNCRLGTNLKEHSHIDPSMPVTFKSLSYNLRCIEALLRNSKKALLGDLSSRESLCIETQIGIARLLGRDRQQYFSSKCLQTMLQTFEQNNEIPSVFQVDPLSILIYLTFSLPTIYTIYSRIPMPRGDILSFYILRFVCIMHIIQILSTMDVNLLINGSTDIENPQHHEILEVLKLVPNKYEEGLLGHVIWKYVQSACLPFLRCCVLFYNHFSGMTAHSSLYDLEGDTFTNMCTYLNIPESPKELFGSTHIMDIIKVWCNHKYLHIQTIPPPTPQNILIKLPHHYSELLNSSALFVCSYCEKSSRTPTMCLLCGHVICRDIYCPKNNLNEEVTYEACLNHVLQCSATVGIFLSIKQCQILYVSAIGSCSVAAPYVDAHGSTDEGLLRGNPLTFCPERYKKLKTFWMSHGVYEQISLHI